MKKRSIALFLAGAMVFGISVGGTMAWLTSGTGTVTNTFTIGEITISLKEHDYITQKDVTGEGGALTEEQIGTLNMDKEVAVNDDYQFVPGATLPKDPFVTVQADSEDCYLFVKVTEANNTFINTSVTPNTTDRIVEWEVKFTQSGNADTGWKLYKEETDNGNDTEYWYREIEKSEADQVWNILKGDQVTISEEIKKDHVDTIKTSEPKLTFEAAAIQSAYLPEPDSNKQETRKADVAFNLIDWNSN